MTFQSLPQMAFSCAGRYDGRPRYRRKENGRWREVSWGDFAERVRHLAAALVDLGIRPGDRVALLSATRPEWMEIDLAILAAGAVTVPIYPSSLQDECGYILFNSEAAVAVVDNEAQRSKIEAVRSGGFELDGSRHSAPVDYVATIEGEGEDGMAALLERGRRRWAEHRDEIEKRISALHPGQLATIVYTSGTTGPPKGVMQTHGNHLAAVEAVGKLGFIEPGDVDFFFLPLAHSFARLMEYVGLYLGTTTAFARNMDTLLEDLRESQPHVIPSVPRIYEKIYSRVQAGRESAGPLKRSLLDWAFRVGRERSRFEQRRERPPASVRWQVRAADRLVLSKVREVLGGRVKFVISGGAPLAPEIAEFFHSAGVLVLEGYGLTETTPILTCNRPDEYKFGTVGRPIEGVSLRIAEDGEILARGPNVAIGYYNRPEATAEAWDDEGWFHTGDIGEVDRDGFLRITDRKKDLIKTSGGKFVAPQAIENLLKTQPHISQAVVVGDNRKYCTALLTVDADEIRRWAEERKLKLPDGPEVSADPRVIELIEREVQAVNAKLPSYATLKYFRLLPRDLSQEAGELTPSLKVKRKVIAERYRDLVDEMYR